MYCIAYWVICMETEVSKTPKSAYKDFICQCHLDFTIGESDEMTGTPQEWVKYHLLI